MILGLFHEAAKADQLSPVEIGRGFPMWNNYDTTYLYWIPPISALLQGQLSVDATGH
jgi:hypothetical protein